MCAVITLFLDSLKLIMSTEVHNTHKWSQEENYYHNTYGSWTTQTTSSSVNNYILRNLRSTLQSTSYDYTKFYCLTSATLLFYLANYLLLLTILLWRFWTYSFVSLLCMVLLLFLYIFNRSFHELYVFNLHKFSVIPLATLQ